MPDGGALKTSGGADGTLIRQAGLPVAGSMTESSEAAKLPGSKVLRSLK